jgi:hypothetical protein
MAAMDGEAKRKQVKMWYASLTEEQKLLRKMRSARGYYQKKGYMPRDHTPLAIWCRDKGYDVARVLSGEQPI